VNIGRVVSSAYRWQYIITGVRQIPDRIYVFLRPRMISPI
jgi:hypothetical protein